MNHHQSSENQSHRKATLSNVAGRLSLPIASLAILCLATHVGNPMWLFGTLWIAFGFAIFGAHCSTGLGQTNGRVTIVLIAVSLLLLAFLILMPGVQNARE